MLTKNPEVADELKRYETYRTEPPVGMHYYGISHNPQLKNFFNTIAGKDRLKVGLHDGVQTLKIVNMIYNSARNIK
jgi:hypothetical protein